MKKKLMMMIIALMLIGGCVKSRKSTSQSSHSSTDKSFKDYLLAEFIDYNDSYLNARFAIKDFSQFNLSFSEDEINWGKLIEEEDYDQKLKELEAYKDQDLTERERVLYDNYHLKLLCEKELQKDKYDYLTNICSPLSSQTSNMGTILLEFPFYTEQDIQDYITLMKSTPDYCDEIIDYLKVQSKKGYFMGSATVDSYVKTLDDFLKKDCPVADYFDRYKFSFDLSEEKRSTYRQEIVDAFQSVTSGFKKVRQTVLDLSSTAASSTTLASYKNGKKYYEAYIRNILGTNLSMRELKSRIKSKMLSTYNDYRDALMKYYGSYMVEESTSFTSYQEILSDLEKKMLADFPALESVSYTVTDMDPAIAKAGNTAYYLVPPIDLPEENYIRFNTTSSSVDISSLDTYTTLAHEGFPGHLYQTNYARQHNEGYLMHDGMEFLGYTEGYATYVQYKAYDYAGVSKRAALLERLNEEYSYYVILLADIYMHYDGQSKTKVSKFLSDAGFGYTEEIYNQLLGDPGIFAAYHMGHMMIEDLKDHAKEELGSRFNEKEFNEALLEYGNISFDVLEGVIDRYIEEKKGN